MKKQVAVRFSHPTFSQETAMRLGIENTIIPIKKFKNTFDILFDNTKMFADQFEEFSNKVKAETGLSPIWRTAFGVDINEPAQASA